MKKELLIKLRDRIKKMPSLSYGLCHEVWYMWVGYEKRKTKNTFTEKEYHALNEYIYKNRPKKGKHFVVEQSRSGYFWPSGMLQPRLDWLNYKIKHYKNEEV